MTCQLVIGREFSFSTHIFIYGLTSLVDIDRLGFNDSWHTMTIKGSKILSRKPRTRSRYRMIKYWFDILLMISILVSCAFRDILIICLI